MFKNIPDNQLATTIFNNLPVAIYTCDAQGHVTSYNKAAEMLWGRQPEIGKDIWCGSWKIFYADGRSMPLEDCPMARTLKNGVAISEEIIIQRPDGAKIKIKPYPEPLFDKNGKLTGAVNTLIDITNVTDDYEKQARLAAIVNNSDDTIVSKTLQGIITSWNKSAEKMFGYTENEAIGQHISLIIPKERLKEEEYIISEISRGNTVDHFQTIRIAKDGHLIPLSITVSPIKDSSGTIIGASKIARDISEQHAAQEATQRYTERLEIINLMIESISEDLDLNKILQKVTDATTELTGAKFGAFFYNTIDDSGQSYMLYTLSGAPKESFDKFGMPRNTAVFNHTFTGQGVVRVDDITKDPRYGKNPPHYGMPKGHLPVVSYLAVPVISRSGEVIGGLFFGHPEPGMFTKEHESIIVSIAAQAAIGIDNAKLYEEVKALNAKKDEFIGLASHELKTPQTSKQLKDIGVANGYDMTFESAVTKMMHLLGQLDDPKEVKRLLETDLRGEITVS